MVHATGRNPPFLTDAPPTWSSFAVDVEKLRSQWFDLDSDAERINRLATALSQGWQIIADLCFRLEHWLSDQHLLPCVGREPFWSVFLQNRDGFGVVARVSDASQFIVSSLKLSSPWRVMRLLLDRFERRLAFSWTILPSFQFALFMAAVSIPYGRPQYNQKAYILNPRMRPAPIGVTGELYLGGIGLALVVGSPFANRTRTETEGLMGPFVNTLALRTQLSRNLTFGDVLRRVREVILEADAHQDLPFEKIVEAVRPPRDPSRNPLFQVNFRVLTAPLLLLKGPAFGMG